MNNEIWRTAIIDGKKTKYKVSNLGNIMNDETGRILSKYMAYGKMKSTLHIRSNGKTGTSYPIDMLVLETFHNITKQPGYVVYYKDGNLANLNIDNLEYITESENIQKLSERIFEKEGDHYIIKDSYLHKDEIWKIIILEDEFTKYMISNYGNLFNILSGLYLNPTIGTYGYPFVTLLGPSKKHKKQMHRLVAEYFVENPYPNLYNIVHHKNNDRTDFKASNLEWTTQSMNTRYSIEDNISKRGEDHVNATIKASDAQKICEMLSNGYRVSEIQRNIGCTRDVIRHIRDRDTWIEISKYYSFDNTYKYFKNQKEMDSIKYLIGLGLTKAAVSGILNIPYSTVSEITNRRDYFIFNIKELIEANVINMFKRGYSITVISELVGLTNDRIQNIINYYMDSEINNP